jgi:hypothetical protein
MSTASVQTWTYACWRKTETIRTRQMELRRNNERCTRVLCRVFFLGGIHRKPDTKEKKLFLFFIVFLLFFVSRVQCVNQQRKKRNIYKELLLLRVCVRVCVLVCALYGGGGSERGSECVRLVVVKKRERERERERESERKRE